MERSSKMLVIPGTGLPRLRTQRGAKVHSQWSLTRTWTRMTRWPLRVSANASFQKDTSAVGLRGDDENILPGFWMSLAFFQPKIVVWRTCIGKKTWMHRFCCFSAVFTLNTFQIFFCQKTIQNQQIQEFTMVVCLIGPICPWRKNPYLSTEPLIYK